MQRELLECDTREEYLPVSAVRKSDQVNSYGSVLGLEDAELADPREIERLVMWQMWGPILALRSRKQRMPGEADAGCCLTPNWPAYGMVDCCGEVPAFVEAECKAADLRMELQRVLGELERGNSRLVGTAKYLVLKYVRMGMVKPEHVPEPEMRALVELYLKARRLQREVRRFGAMSLREEDERLARFTSMEQMR